MSNLDLSGEHADDPPEPPAEPDKPRRRRGTRKTPRTRTVRTDRKPTEADLRKRIDDGLIEVIAFVNDWLGWPDVAEAMEADRGRMAEVLAARATRHTRLAVWLTRIFGKDSLLAFARAFGPTVRAVRQQFHLWREARATEQPEPIIDGDGWFVDPITGQRTGERAAAA